MNFIFIEGLRVDALVGIYSRERLAPQTIEFDLSFGVPEAAAIHDNIADTIDYAAVVEYIRAELAGRHFNLIETLGEFVADLLCEKFAAPWVKIRLAKLGVMKGVRRVGVYIQRGKPENSVPGEMVGEELIGTQQ
ncbi:MAG: dihydroneopterin aldolase [Azoarcus sp.]|jgi:dihydroneopterin aldolase|nr:dihydroneopterin aldolase [Azoarcus sp.]